MAAPTLEASGTVAVVTTGNLTVTLPTHQAADILVVVVSGWVPNTTTGTNQMAAPAGGWAKLLSDPLINTTIDGEWAIFWLRATAAGTTNPAFTRPASWDTGTDTNWSGRAYVIRGCAATGNPWDAAAKSALHSTANQAFPAVTVSGSERTVIQFLSKADDNGGVTAATGWTIDTAAITATGTDASFQTIRKNNVSTSTTADTATITAPATGLRYQFYGISFKPDPPTTITPVESVSATVSDTAQLSVHAPLPPVTISGTESTSATVSDVAGLVSPGTPTAPLTLAGSPGSNGEVTLTWSAPTGFQGVAELPFATSVTTRYIQDQYSNPWLGIGDTAWGIVAQLNNTEITTYLENRAAKGVNLVVLSAPEAFYGNNAPNNIENTAGPFTETVFQSTLNNTYWTRVDHVVSEANRLGITLLICPFYIGWWDADGWGAQIEATSNAQMQTYAGYINTRYGSASNIMWIIGHDRDAYSATHIARMSAWVNEFQSLNNHLILPGGSHGNPGNFAAGSVDLAADGSIITWDIDTQYDYTGETAVNATTMWGLSPTRPFIFFEGIYEQEIPGPLGIGDVLLREQMWASFCNGATGVVFGNNPIWAFGSTRLPTAYTGTWQQNMDYEGSTYLQKFAAIVDTLGTSWATMNADTTSTFYTNQGTGTTKGAARFNTSGAVVYRCNGGSDPVTLNLTELSNWSTVTITRYDPVSGASTTVGTYPTTGNQNVVLNSANSTGDEYDWVLIVTGAS